MLLTARPAKVSHPKDMMTLLPELNSTHTQTQTHTHTSASTPHTPASPSSPPTSSQVFCFLFSINGECRHFVLFILIHKCPKHYSITWRPAIVVYVCVIIASFHLFFFTATCASSTIISIILIPFGIQSHSTPSLLQEEETLDPFFWTHPNSSHLQVS